MTVWRGEAGGHDAFEQEIESLLAVEPAPAWTAAVRGRFSTPPPRARGMGTLACAATVAVVVLGGAALWQRVAEAPPPQVPLATVATPALIPHSPVEIAPATSTPSGTDRPSIRG